MTFVKCLGKFLALQVPISTYKIILKTALQKKIKMTLLFKSYLKYAFHVLNMIWMLNIKANQN